MHIEELRQVCQEAARDLLSKEGRPLPPALVLPREQSTQVLLLTGLPDDDEARLEAMAHLADEQLTARGTPAWGFLSEGELVEGAAVAVVVYGARRHRPMITAALFVGDGLTEFEPPEELDPHAFPFLHPLQRAVDALPAETPPDADGGGLPLV